MIEPQSLLFWGGPKHLQRITCRGSIVRFVNPDGGELEYTRCSFQRMKWVVGEELPRVEKAHIMILSEPRSIAEYDEIAKQMNIHLVDDDWKHNGFGRKDEML